MTGLLHRHSAAPIWSERLGSISLAMLAPSGLCMGSAPFRYIREGFFLGNSL